MLAIQGKLYRNTAAYNSPTWAAIDLVADVQVNPAWDEADGSVRASRVKQFAKTMMGLEISARVRVDLTDAGYLALLGALHSDTPLDLMILNGDKTTNGVTGYRADFHVMSAGEDQSLGNVLFREFTLKPAVSSNDAQKVTVASGAPVFSDIDGS